MGTIFLAGVYGVGKSTIASALTEHTGIPNYSASTLISKRNGELYGANKVVLDKNRNQAILAACVSELLAKSDQIILDGHFCIVNNQDNVEELPEDVFENLNLEKIVLLEAPYSTILSHLMTRDGKSYSAPLIQAMLETEHRLATRVAERLQCPLIIHKMNYSHSDIERLIHEI